MKTRQLFATLIVAGLLIVLAGCGKGSGSSVPVNPPPDPPSTPTASPVAGTYNSTQSVMLTSTNSTSIRYTLDGTVPTCSTGTTYASAVSISSTTTVAAIGCNSAGASATASFKYTIAPLPSGTFSASVTSVASGSPVTLTWTSKDATSCSASANPSQGDWTGALASCNSSASVVPTLSAGGDVVYSINLTGLGGKATLTTTVTVLPPPAVTSATPLFQWLDDDSPATAFIGMKAMGTGFASGQTTQIVPSLPFTKVVVQNATEMDFTVVYDTSHWRPGRYTVAFCGPTCGDSAPFYFSGNQNTLAVSSVNGEMYLLDQAAGLIRKYKSDGSSDGAPINIGGAGTAIAFDSESGMLIGSTLRLAGAGSIDPVTGNSVNNITGSAVGVAGADGVGCVAQPVEGLATTFGDAPNSTVPTLSQPAGKEPWAVAIAALGSGKSCVVYSRGNTSLYQYSLANMTAQGSLQFTGLATGGEPEVVAFNQDSAAGTVAVFSQADNKLAFAALSSTGPTFTRTVQLDSTPSSQPQRIVADEVGGRVIVAYANPVDPSKLTSLVAVNALTGAKQTLNATSATAPVGFGISPDNSKLLLCDGSGCAAPTPNN